MVWHMSCPFPLRPVLVEIGLSFYIKWHSCLLLFTFMFKRRGEGQQLCTTWDPLVKRRQSDFQKFDKIYLIGRLSDSTMVNIKKYTELFIPLPPIFTLENFLFQAYKKFTIVPWDLYLLKSFTNLTLTNRNVYNYAILTIILLFCWQWHSFRIHTLFVPDTFNSNANVVQFKFENNSLLHFRNTFTKIENTFVTRFFYISDVK